MLKKYYIGLAIVLLFAAYVARQDKNYPDSTAQESASPNNTSISAVADNAHPAEHKENTQRHFPRWYRLFTWPEGVTTWALMLTLLAIAEQTKHTARAAEAANRGMEVSKTKERAKLLLTIKPLTRVIGDIPEAKLRITNVGESSAIFGRAIAGLHISDSDTIGQHGSGYYWLKIDHTLLKSEESSEETIWWPQHALWRYRNVADIEGDKQLTVHLHGIINFRDAFEDWWRLKFHYIWRPYGFEVWMPHLQENITGEWEDQTNGEGETRIEKPSKKKWWEFWKKSEPIPESRPN